MVGVITKSMPIILERTSRVGMAAALMTAQLLVAIIGINQFPNTALAASATSSPTIIVNDTSQGADAWMTPTSALSSNNVDASVSGSNFTSNNLKATGFGFSIPTDATINGVEVRVERRASNANNVTDARVHLVVNGSIITASNKAGTTDWSNTDTVVTYGSSSDLWSTTLLPADVNATNFGLVFAAKSTGNRTAYVDHVNITVHYTEADEDDTSPEIPPTDSEDEDINPVLIPMPDKVTICHRTNSIRNPYTRITVNSSAVDGEGANDHTGHNEGGPFDPSVHTQNGDDWGDIIPPYIGHPGLNWTVEGQAIYDNNCVYPTVGATGTVIIVKEVEPSTSEERFSFLSEDLNIETTETIGDSESIVRENISTGDYTVEEVLSEIQSENFELDSVVCEVSSNNQNGIVLLEQGYDFNPEEDSVTFSVYENQTTTCTFTNVEIEDDAVPGTVNVLKYEDFNRNGVRDEGEPTLEGWEITLRCENSMAVAERSLFEVPTPVDECSQRSKITDENGEVVFNEVEGDRLYTVDEVIGEDRPNWQKIGIVCSVRTIREDKALVRVVDNEIELPENVFYMDDNATVDCEIGNARDVVLELAKINDANTPKLSGSIVTYTLIVTHPLDSSVSYNTVVTDLPPENFIYNGVYSFELSNSSALRTDPLNVPDPNYQSPGQWSLGTVYPGEVVTLTYQTVINNQVSPGDYPDVAFVRGFTQPEDGVEVLGNGVQNPFVQTDVTVVLGQAIGNVSFQPTTAVLGTLINTGERVHPLHYLLPLTIIVNAVLLIQLTTRTSVQKGAK